MRNQTDNGRLRHVPAPARCHVLLLDEWFVPRQAAKGQLRREPKRGKPMVGEEAKLHCYFQAKIEIMIGFRFLLCL